MRGPLTSHLTSHGSKRTGWDSNPRYPYGHTGFRDRLFQPLGHRPSGEKLTGETAISYRLTAIRQAIGQRLIA